MRKKKCVILVPTSYNDGTQMPEHLINRLRMAIYERFDGVTVAGTVQGAYRMADGDMAEDVCLVFWVAVEPKDVPALKAIVRPFARMLKQESIYFEVTESEVELLGTDGECGVNSGQG